MAEDLRTTAVVQRHLDQLHGESPAEPIIRSLLAHATGRLRILCASMLVRDYPRLMRPPLNLGTDEMLSGVVERLLKAMEKTRPPTVRQFFGLVNQHMRWELNEFARRLDACARTVALQDEYIPAPESSDSALSPATRRMLDAIDALPNDDREVFELVRLQGMSSAEVAGIIGVTERTVQRRVNRALLRLMDVLDDLGPPALHQGGAR